MYQKMMLMRVVLLSLAFIAVTGCGSSNPLESDSNAKGSIAGTIKYIGSLQPDGSVNLNLWKDWPTVAAPVVSMPLDAFRSSEDFVLANLAQGSYAALTIDWKPDDGNLPEKVLGVYWANSDSVGSNGSKTLLVTPAMLEIKSENLTLTDVKVKVDLGLIQ